MTMPYGDEFFCGCIVDFDKKLDEPGYSIECEMHDRTRPWASILNGSSHWVGAVTQYNADGSVYHRNPISRRYIGGCYESDLHNLFWIMGGIKPAGAQPA